jgi:FtsZ-binding cell division protein ZapB
MAVYDDLKKKAKEALDTIADVSVEAYKIAEEKAKILARRTRLNAEITRERAAIRRMKIRIGDTYYELHKDDAEDAQKEFCESITTSLDLIAGKQRELEELKKKNVVNDAEGDAGCESGCDCSAGSDNKNENNDENQNQG